MSTLRARVRVPVLLLLAALVPGVTLPTSALAAPRVIGGSKVDHVAFDSQWRSVVSLQFRSQKRVADAHFCGGTLIAERIVLTARHCIESGDFHDEARDIAVYGGSPSLAGGGVRVNVTAIHASPDADFFRSGGDIALLQLEAPVPGTSPAAFARPEHATWWGAGAGRPTGVQVAGWGVMRDGDVRLEREFGPGAVDLQSVELPVLAAASCAALAKWDRSVSRHICASSLERPATSAREGRSACYGDSGGPLLASDPAGLEPPRVVGIVSRGTDLQCAAGPGIFTTVAARADWIDRVIAQLDEDPVLRAAEPVVTRLTPAGRNSYKWFAIAGAQPGDRFRVDVRPPSGRGWFSTGSAHEGSVFWRKFGQEAAFIAPPTRSGRLQVRVMRTPVDGLDREIHRETVPVSVDQASPGAVPRMDAVRRRYAHLLSWGVAVDRRDRVVGYVIEQRRAGTRRWESESVNYCQACVRHTATRPSLRSIHILLPGRRQFRVAALDRAGNIGPWTVSR